MNCADSRSTHAVQGLFFSVQFHCGHNDSGHGVDVEVFPVSVTRSSLQEAIADLSVHSLVRVRCVHLIHGQSRGLFLHGEHPSMKLSTHLSKVVFLAKWLTEGL